METGWSPSTFKEAYLQVPIHPDSCKFLRFVAFDRVYQFCALCFGISTAPQVFTRVMAPVSSILLGMGIHLRRYLDDWLIQASSREEVLRSLETVLALCLDLGIIVNPEKSNFVPAQRVQYLGTIIDSMSFRASSQQRVDKLLSIGDEFLSSRLQPASPWQVLLGILSYLSHLVLGCRLCMWSLQLTLHRCWDRVDDSTLIPWDVCCLHDLSWWLDPFRLQEGVSLAQVSPDLDFWSDASDVGWGAHLGREVVSSRWSAEDASLSINARELLCSGARSPSLSSSGRRLHSFHLLRRLHGGGLPLELKGDSFCNPQHHSAEDPLLSRVSSRSSGPSVHHGLEQCPRRCPVQAQPNPGLQVVKHGSLQRPPALLAGHDRPLCHLSRSPLLSLFFSFLESSSSGDGCASPQLGPSLGVCVPSVGLASSGPSEAPVLVRHPDDPNCSALASTS